VRGGAIVTSRKRKIAEVSGREKKGTEKDTRGEKKRTSKTAERRSEEPRSSKKEGKINEREKDTWGKELVN